MMRALWSSASGMVAQQKNIDVISNNISNVNTVGFKGSRADFQDMIYQVIQPAGTLNQERTIPTGIEIGHGTQLVATPTRFAQGDLIDTEDTLDMAIQGDGFFRVKMQDNQTYYTRAGAFTLDESGTLVTANGLPLDPPIQIPPEAEDVLIAEDGTVSTRAAGDIEPTIAGSIELALFPNPRGLQHEGRGLYKQTSATGQEKIRAPGQLGAGIIRSGMLEMSNVKIVDEMVGMIVAQRSYEANAKSIQTADEMLGTANTLRR